MVVGETTDLQLVEINGEEVVVRIKNGGKLSNNKGINVPDVKLSMPFVSEKDRNDIIFGIENGFDFIALSFTRCKEDVLEVRKILEEHGCTDMKIIAKLENAEGVEKLDEILEVVDAIIVARGDMGVEIPFMEIPRLQKEIIHKCFNSGKPAITATQMLDSMIEKPRPTRAEVTDVANAVFDGTSMAAPIVSGTVALMKSLKPEISVSDILHILQATGQIVSDYIPPMIQVDDALMALKTGVIPKMKDNNMNNQPNPNKSNENANSKETLPISEKKSDGTDYNAIRELIESYKQKINELEKLLPENKQNK